MSATLRFCLLGRDPSHLNAALKPHLPLSTLSANSLKSIVPLGALNEQPKADPNLCLRGVEYGEHGGGVPSDVTDAI